MDEVDKRRFGDVPTGLVEALREFARDSDRRAGGDCQRPESVSRDTVEALLARNLLEVASVAGAGGAAKTYSLPQRAWKLIPRSEAEATRQDAAAFHDDVSRLAREEQDYHRLRGIPARLYSSEETLPLFRRGLSPAQAVVALWEADDNAKAVRS